MNHQSNTRHLMQAYRSGLLIPENTGAYWSDEERDRLQARFLEGAGISEMALEFQRSENGIVNQLLVMDLLIPPQAVRQSKPRRPKCLCSRCQLPVCPVKGG